jgi:hypothetical protein
MRFHLFVGCFWEYEIPGRLEIFTGTLAIITIFPWPAIANSADSVGDSETLDSAVFE